MSEWPVIKADFPLSKGEHKTVITQWQADGVRCFCCDPVRDEVWGVSPWYEVPDLSWEERCEELQKDLRLLQFAYNLAIGSAQPNPTNSVVVPGTPAQWEYAGVAYVEDAVVVPQAEERPPRPGPGWYWIRGHWRSRKIPPVQTWTCPGGCGVFGFGVEKCPECGAIQPQTTVAPAAPQEESGHIPEGCTIEEYQSYCPDCGFEVCRCEPIPKSTTTDAAIGLITTWTEGK